MGLLLKEPVLINSSCYRTHCSRWLLLNINEMFHGWTAGKCSEKREAEAMTEWSLPWIWQTRLQQTARDKGSHEAIGSHEHSTAGPQVPAPINSMIAKALKLFCPRAAKWMQVHFQKEKEVEQTKVSQFLPCDSESFPRSIWDGWVDTHYISSSTVLPREHLTSCHSDEHVQDQGKTHRKHGKVGFWDKLLHYYILWRVSSLQRKCCPSCTVPAQPSMICARIAAGESSTAEQGESKEQARQGVITDSLLLEWKHRDFAQIPCSVPWKPGAACASLYNP